MRPLTLLAFLSVHILITSCSHFPGQLTQEPKPESEPQTQTAPSWPTSTTPVTVLSTWPNTSEENQPDDVWQRIRNSFQFDLTMDNERIKQQRDRYAKHPDYITRVSSRGAPYIHYISEQIDVRRIPGELALLPIVESAFDPFAYSHGRAAGVWQFIPSTGRYFGLKQDWWHDGRRDIRAATNAALDYLTSLSNQFDGDWMLALASYNAGGGTVRRAIRRNIEAGKPTDFWSLDLPKETRAYVPKLIALAQLLKNPQKYNVAFVPVNNTPHFIVAGTAGQIDLSQVATLANTDLDEIYRLNPQYNRWATHPDGPHEVLLPVAAHAHFVRELAALPQQDRLKWHRYVVKSGDNLGAISQRFRTTTDVIRSSNNLRGNLIRVGQTLMIPGARKTASNYALSSTERKTRTAKQRQPKKTQKHQHTILKGESLWGIARKYGVKTNQLTHWNSMAPGDPLRVGKTLVVYLSGEVPLPRNNRQEIRTVRYQVRKGDSLSSIASRFNVSVKDIRKWNPKIAKAKYLRPGNKVELKVNVVR